MVAYPETNFNPRPREGSDKSAPSSPSRQTISIHAPAKGATKVIKPKSRQTQNFNPRPREGSDFFLELSQRIRNISIHAPAKGATAVRYSLMMYQIISIHAPAKGATSSRPPFSRSRSIFQSTPPRRERLL